MMMTTTINIDDETREMIDKIMEAGFSYSALVRKWTKKFYNENLKRFKPKGEKTNE